MKQIMFAGAYGIRSQGDDAALLALVEELRRRRGEFDGVVLARHAAEGHYAKYGLRTVQNFEYDTRAESVGKWFRGFNCGDDLSTLRSIYREVRRSDAVVFGAGNALIDVSIGLLRGAIPYFVLLTLMAAMADTPFVWYGISVGPFRTRYARDLSRLAARLASSVTVRDERSEKELRRLGFSGSLVSLPDPVLGLLPPPSESAPELGPWREAHEHGRPVLAVSVRAATPAGGSLSSYLEAFASFCDDLIVRHNVVLLFVPHCTYEHARSTDDDRFIAASVVARMEHRESAVEITDHLSVEHCLAAYQGARAAVCMRLHANVFAAIQGVPSLAIDYNPKVGAFMEWLGASDAVVGFGDVTPGAAGAKLAMLLRQRGARSAGILAQVRQGRIQSGGYADMVEQFVWGNKRARSSDLLAYGDPHDS